MLIQGPGGLLSTTVPFAWVDTNVMVEIYTFGDIMDAKRNGTDLKVEERRLRMQGSLWMATVLCLGKAVTLSYSHEGMRNVGKYCPPNSDVAEWSKLMLFLFSEGGVLDGWTQGTTSMADDRGAAARDTFMAEQCAYWGMKLIGRDDGALKKARARGVDALEPEQWADPLMPCSLARRCFMQRLDTALKLYTDRCPPEHRAGCDKTVRAVRAVYEYIWTPAGSAEPFSAESMFR